MEATSVLSIEELSLSEIKKLRVELSRNGSRNVLSNRVKGALSFNGPTPILDTHILWVIKEKELTIEGLEEMFEKEKKVLRYIKRLL